MMLAARLHSPGAPLTVEDVPMPVLGPGEALVQVVACGVCGSDVHMWRGAVPVRKTPIVLGHEIAGRVAACGSEVSSWKAGDLVIVRAATGCGDCRHCLSGRDNLCAKQRVLGMDLDGGFAEYVKAPAASLVPLPTGVPFEIGAILTDAVATPYHALTGRGALQPGESVAVFGCGGLGTHAVQLASLLGAGALIAVDVRPSALARARELGAHEAIDAQSEAPYKAIQRLTGEGVDLVLECVGRPETIAQAVRSLRPGGRAVIVGMGEEPLSLPPPSLFAWREYGVLGSFGSTRRDLERVIELVQSGRLDLGRSITARLPLEEVNKALETLESREGDLVRLVVLPWEGG
jgi:2-desacetyl-2-hydroxyethyl bacteriochlorophyllide A dehydrogenase